MGGAVSPLLWELCIGLDVLVFKNVPVRSREVLSNLTGARPVSYLSQCSEVSETKYSYDVSYQDEIIKKKNYSYMGIFIEFCICDHQCTFSNAKKMQLN